MLEKRKAAVNSARQESKASRSKISGSILWTETSEKYSPHNLTNGVDRIFTIDFKELGDYLGDPVIITATVDRMIHHSIIINIEGPSWRLHESQQLNARK
jgi:hypothetical protein